MYGITYNNKHSFYDFNINVLNTRNISSPTKRKVYESIPFTNSVFDFSDIYGEAHFDDRVLEYEFLIRADNSNELELTRIEIENWLLSSNEKTRLVDDNTPNHYFMAECISIEFEDLGNYGKLKAIFEAYPYRFADELETLCLWDPFRFEIDTLQASNFTIDGELTIEMYNKHNIKLVPVIECTSNMEIVKNNKSYIFNSGKTENFDFYLNPFDNKFIVKGSGKIKFLFRKMVL